MDAVTSIFRVLRRCRGRENSIGAAEIAQQIGWPRGRARDVRRVIADHRDAWEAELGTAICTVSGGGFWLATDFEEVAALVELFDHAAETAAKKAQSIRASMARIGFRVFETTPRRRATAPSDREAELLRAVFARQDAARLSNGEVARRLRVAKSTWSRIRSGQYAGKIPAKALRGAEAFLRGDA